MEQAAGIPSAKNRTGGTGTDRRQGIRMPDEAWLALQKLGLPDDHVMEAPLGGDQTVFAVKYVAQHKLLELKSGKEGVH